MRCGLLGERLGHSWSRELHALFADYDYELFEVKPEELGDFLRTRDFHGLNVTIPYKTTMLDICDELTETAQAVGSVNTVVRLPDGALLGDNTDAAGFEAMVWKSRIHVLGRKCLVLGSGGASLAVQYVLRKLGAGQVVVISRMGEDNYEMYPHTTSCPIDLRDFPRCEGVLDLIYNPARTALMQQAEALGIPSQGGLYMLCEQARQAAQRFTGRPIPSIRTKEVYSTLMGRKENRVLIGMPGCGKSTVGRKLAEALDRPFFDCDAELEQILKMPVSDYINLKGEKAFRRHETALLAQLGKQSGLVIATGGGCVTQPENYPLLHQNGAIVFLERELSKLPKRGRPLSLRGSLQDMYTIRFPMYRRFADFTVTNDGPIDRVVQRVEEVYEHFSD